MPNEANGEIVDIHVHFGAPRDGESGCFWSEEFTKSPAYYAMLLVTKSLLKKVDIQHVKKHMLSVINGSKFVSKTVLLAMDQVYDDVGHPHPEKTHLYVPNQYIAKLARENSRVLFGASVHPFRSDWSEELDYCLKNKAVLCKWIPSSQKINPTHLKCLPFYEKLAEYRLPLLCHVGPEGAIPPFDEISQKLNSPNLLRNALDSGVVVIAAHVALPLLPPPLENDRAFQELIALFLEAESKGGKLYADLSAINLGPRNSYIDKINNEIPPQRLIFGSDYPIPILDISQRPHLGLGHWLKHFFQTIFIKNPLDKNYRLIKNMDFDEALFYNASNILRLA